MLRVATLGDAPRITELIAASARGLGRTHYSEAQIERALRGAFGVDTQLIADRTYFIVEAGTELAGCGGWSYRRTLFGSDERAARDPAALDPAVDAARIRAFFVHPAHARRGVGTLLLSRCESAAAAAGFGRAELMGTLSGVEFYRSQGYVGIERVDWPAGDGIHIPFLRMGKTFDR